jgi:hypothetical protein
MRRKNKKKVSNIVKEQKEEKTRKHEEKCKRKLQHLRETRSNVRKINHYIKSEDKKKSTPHPLIVLSTETFNRIKDNSIILTEMNREQSTSQNSSDGGTTRFIIKSAGCNVTCLVNEVWCKGRSLDSEQQKKINGGYLILLCEVIEQCLTSDKRITFIRKGIEEATNYVLLMIFNFENSNAIDEGDDLLHYWDNSKDLCNLQRFKKSTIKKNLNHHYGSAGECYSFGLRNNFSRSDCGKITITNYKGDNVEIMEDYKKYLWDTMNRAFSTFNKVIPGYVKYLNLTSKMMYQQSKTNVLNSIIEINMDNPSNMLTGNININATTCDIHCEMDVTYTTIHVPKQTEISAYIVFEFQINHFISITLDVMQNATLTYSAYCLGHRQVATNGCNCMNVSTYSTKRLFSNYKQTYNRIKLS